MIVDSAGRLRRLLADLLTAAKLESETLPLRRRAIPLARNLLILGSGSGCGVEPGIRRRLFDRFATGDSLGGTGLGLFIVRELARAHGGTPTTSRRRPATRGAAS